MSRVPALLFAASALLFSGCAAVKHSGIPYDNPRPANFANVPGCRGAMLAAGAQCVALVRANQWYSDSHLSTTVGESYCVSVPGVQRWFDLERVNDAPDGEPGSGLMNLYASRKRFRDPSGLRPGETEWQRARVDGWFALVAAVVKPGARDADDREVLQQASMGGPRDCGGDTGKLLKIDKPGDLVFYPNDAALSDNKKQHFYGNNSGQVWVVITKMQ
jgi:hypothetical protein